MAFCGKWRVFNDVSIDIGMQKSSAVELFPPTLSTSINENIAAEFYIVQPVVVGAVFVIPFIEI